MSFHEGESGIWAVYSYGNDGGPVVSRISDSVVDLLPGADSFEHVFFWPTGTELRDAIAWFRKEKELPDDSQKNAEVQQKMAWAIKQIMEKSSESKNSSELHSRLAERLNGLFHIRERYE